MEENNKTNKEGGRQALIGSIIVILVLALGGWFLLANREADEQTNGALNEQSSSDELEIIEQETAGLEIDGELEAGLEELEQNP